MNKAVSPRLLACLLLAGILLLAAAGVLVQFGSLATAMGIPSPPWGALLSPAVPEDPSLARLHTILWQVRLPRVLLAILVGAALALSGVTMQAVFQNPLAEPYIVGVASGAGLGAAISAALKIPAQWGPFDSNPVFVFAGGVLAALLVYGLSYRHGQIAVLHLLLIGIATSALCGGLSSYLLWFQRDLHRILFLLMGTLSKATLHDVWLVLPIVLGCALLLQLTSRSLDALQLGDDTAHVLGLNVRRVREIALGLGVLLAATAVAVSGVIGFIGLVVPHTVRLLVGPKHHSLLLCAALGGAFLLLAADTGARVLHSAEIPVGIITTFLGVPFFLYLLRRGGV